MNVEQYNALYRYIIIDFQLKDKPKVLKENNIKFTDGENWKITKSNITYGYKGEQTKKYIQEDWVIHNRYMKNLIKEQTCNANIAKAIQLNNRLFVEAIKPYREGKLSEKESINDMKRRLRQDEL